MELWTPNATNDGIHKKLIQTSMREGGPGAAATGGGSDQHKPRTPPPDLPSLLLDSRIIYLGMPLVPAVTELIISELLYCQVRPASNIPDPCAMSPHFKNPRTRSSPLSLWPAVPRPQ